MNDDPAGPKSEPSDEAWHEIDELVEEIARLSKSELSATDFYATLLERIVSGLAAVGGMVWTREPSGGLRLQCQINPPDTPLAGTGNGEDRHLRLLELVLEAGKGRITPPRSAGAAQDPAANPTEFLAALCPWAVEDGVAGVIEVFQRPGASPGAQRGWLQFLEVICELVTDFHRHRQLCDLRQHAAQWGRWDQFAERVHGSLDLRTTAYLIANEGRRLIGCDRVSVLVRRGSRCRMMAVSGVDTFHRRATAVRLLERLSAAVVAVDEPLWYTGAAGDTAPQIEKLANAYVDQSHVRWLAVLPLKVPEGEDPRRRPQAVGALVAEQFVGNLDDQVRESVAAVLRHSALALQNAKQVASLPLVRLLGAVGKARWFVEAGRLPKVALAVLTIAAVVTALSVVPADFNVQARGELQPLRMRDVFAPADGVVTDLRVAHGEHADAGGVLLVLHKPELDLDFKRLWGELQTARTKLAAVEAERIQTPHEGEEQRRRHRQLTAQQEELRALISSLEQQYAILEEKQAELQIRSPIAGEVLTWNLQQLLEARPVNRGQILMTVADLQGPWALELRVPDRRIAHVLAAQRQSGGDLEVSFVLATDPGMQLRGAVRQVGMRTEVAEAEDPFVLVAADIAREEMPHLVPGATVTARIHCGRRAVGYVWLHDLFDAIQSWFLCWK